MSFKLGTAVIVTDGEHKGKSGCVLMRSVEDPELYMILIGIESIPVNESNLSDLNKQSFETSRESLFGVTDGLEG